MNLLSGNQLTVHIDATYMIKHVNDLVGVLTGLVCVDCFGGVSQREACVRASEKCLLGGLEAGTEPG